MNHVYRVVWNATQGVWQAVCELVSSQGKAKSSRRTVLRKTFTVAFPLTPAQGVMGHSIGNPVVHSSLTCLIAVSLYVFHSHAQAETLAIPIYGKSSSTSVGYDYYVGKPGSEGTDIHYNYSKAKCTGEAGGDGSVPYTPMIPERNMPTSGNFVSGIVGISIGGKGGNGGENKDSACPGYDARGGGRGSVGGMYGPLSTIPV